MTNSPAPNKNRNLIGYLTQLPLLQGIPTDVLEELAGQLEGYTLTTGEKLFKQGDPGTSLYIIKEGHIKVVAQTAGGDELILNQFGPGEFFGEMSLIDQEPRSAGAVAMTPMVLFKLSRQNFEQVLVSHPLTILEITRSLSQKLRFAAAYIQKAIEWSEQVAAGNYSSAIGEIESAKSIGFNQQQSNEAQIKSLISTFFTMVEGVKAREDDLKREVMDLKIKIDYAKREHQVTEITETEYFERLQKEASILRKRKKQAK